MFPLNIARGLISIISTPPPQETKTVRKKSKRKEMHSSHTLLKGALFFPNNSWPKQVRKALSYAPRKKRSLWVLNVTALWQLFVREGWGVNPMGRQLHLCYFPKIWDIITKSSRFWEPKLQILHVTGIFTYNWPKKLRIWTMEQAFFVKVWTCLKGVCFSLGGSIMGWTSPTRSRDAFWNTPH